MNNFFALGAVAAADVARSAIVLDAMLRQPGIDTLALIGVALATGGVSLTLVGLAVRALLDARHLAPIPSPS